MPACTQHPSRCAAVQYIRRVIEQASTLLRLRKKLGYHIILKKYIIRTYTQEVQARLLTTQGAGGALSSKPCVCVLAKLWLGCVTWLRCAMRCMSACVCVCVLASTISTQNRFTHPSLLGLLYHAAHLVRCRFPGIFVGTARRQGDNAVQPTTGLKMCYVWVCNARSRRCQQRYLLRSHQLHGPRPPGPPSPPGQQQALRQHRRRQPRPSRVIPSH